MTVYDHIKTMPKDELQKLIYYIYLWGHTNEQCGVDDECFYKHLLDLPAHHVDNIINALDNLSLVKVCIHNIEDSSAYYLDTKFFSVEDASQYLNKYIKGIVKVDDTTYANATNIFRIIT